jgi:hypothetical protein
MVCENCLKNCFSIKEFRDLCVKIGSQSTVEYTVDEQSCRASASDNCGWCTLILQIREQGRDIIPPEFRTTSSEIEVKLTTGILHEDYTPPGNNRFRLWVDEHSAHLTAFTDAENIVSKLVTARPLQHEINSDQAFERITQWLQLCAAHPECAPSVESPLPTRLIELGTKQTGGSIRLSSTKGSHGKYAALSYCWGSRQPGVTMKSNLKDRMLSIDASELSKTVQEAITITQRLGFQYLWVDAICIIQDSDEDKSQEIQQMCDIYRNAHVAIVAATASDSNQGFLQSRPLPSPSVEVPFWSTDNRLSSVSMRPEGWYSDDSEPVNTRGWTLQERLLSPRLVIFASHTIQLQCQHSIINMGDSLNIPSGLGSWRLPSPLVSTTPKASIEPVTSEAAIREWKNVIMLYSERKLSSDNDKLVAVAALAQSFHSIIQLPYLAGLWSGPTLLPMLLWESCYYTGIPTYKEYIAPSWSWASVPATVTFRAGHVVQDMAPFDVDLLSSSTTLKNKSMTFGQVSAGRITLKAHIKNATFIPPHSLDWHDSQTNRPRRHHLPRRGIYPADFVLPDSEIMVSLDCTPSHTSIDILCFALVIRRYEFDGMEYETVDGLLIERVQPLETTNEYRRVGCFFGAFREDFQECERKEIILI